jgi:hypothetical protein
MLKIKRDRIRTYIFFKKKFKEFKRFTVTYKKEAFYFLPIFF